MNNTDRIKINTNNSTKLFGILAISVIATLMVSTSVVPYAYATNAPIITSLVVDDPDDLDDTYSSGDIITILFDSDTNMPSGQGKLTEKDVLDLFTFTESLGKIDEGEWVTADKFMITIKDAKNAGPPVIGLTTVTPAGVLPILSADETSVASSVTSPVLSGDFGEPPFPNQWIDASLGVIYYDGGNVGIGTSLPNNLLSVNGIIESTSGGFMFPDGSIQSTANLGNIEGVTAGIGLLGGGVSGSITLDVDTSIIQNRVTGTCSVGSSISAINSDGTVICETDDIGIITEIDPVFDLSVASGITSTDITNWNDDQVDDADNDPTNELQDWSTLPNIPTDIADGDDVGTGDITGVTAGIGLSGGGISGDVTLDVDTSIIQNRVTGSCSVGSSISAINLDGTVSCETDDVGTGDITAVSGGEGIIGGSTSGDATLSIERGHELYLCPEFRANNVDWIFNSCVGQITTYDYCQKKGNSGTTWEFSCEQIGFLVQDVSSYPDKPSPKVIYAGTEGDHDITPIQPE